MQLGVTFTFARADSDPAYQWLLRQFGFDLPEGCPLVTPLDPLDREATSLLRQGRGPSSSKSLDEE